MGLLLLTAAVTAPAQNVFSMKDTTIQANTTVATLELHWTILTRSQPCSSTSSSRSR